MFLYTRLLSSSSRCMCVSIDTVVLNVRVVGTYTYASVFNRKNVGICDSFGMRCLAGKCLARYPRVDYTLAVNIVQIRNSSEHWFLGLHHKSQNRMKKLEKISTMAMLISPVLWSFQPNHCIHMLSNTYGRGLSKQISDSIHIPASDFPFGARDCLRDFIKGWQWQSLLLKSLIQYKTLSYFRCI